MTRVGWIGLGIMGRGMAANLLAKGFPLVVFNRTASKVDGFVERGAERASSPAEVAARSEVVLTCVSDTPDVKSVLFGEGGVSERVSAGQVVVDLSTISPKKTREFAERFSTLGVEFLDAPVSGGSEGAERGTLSVMVGGSATALERVRPVLEAFSKRIVHVGPSGSGQLMKLVNQILVAGSMLSMAEALLFAQASGLDLAKTLEVVTAGAANSWTLENRGPQVIRRDFRPGFTVDLQQKDLRLVLEAGDELGVPLQGTSTAFHYYRAVQQHGGGGDGNHALVKALELLSGITLGKKS
jgi:3-hydroxyisobutyrate dehydrogenase-like beta-hydroxyacid dehydrogenase